MLPFDQFWPKKDFSWALKKDTTQRLINSYVKDNRLRVFLFSYFLYEFFLKMSQTSFLILKASKVLNSNPWIFIHQIVQGCHISISSLNFKHIDRTKCNASWSKKWLENQFKTQTLQQQKKIIHKYLKNVSCKWKWYSTIYSNNNWFVVTKDNGLSNPSLRLVTLKVKA